MSAPMLADVARLMDGLAEEHDGAGGDAGAAYIRECAARLRRWEPVVAAAERQADAAAALEANPDTFRFLPSTERQAWQDAVDATEAAVRAARAGAP